VRVVVRSRARHTRARGFGSYNRRLVMQTKTDHECRPQLTADEIAQEFARRIGASPDDPGTRRLARAIEMWPDTDPVLDLSDPYDGLLTADVGGGR
jgi:hypothetical protein